MELFYCYQTEKEVSWTERDFHTDIHEMKQWDG
jgi:hypothetical protein